MHLEIEKEIDRWFITARDGNHPYDICDNEHPSLLPMGFDDPDVAQEFQRQHLNTKDKVWAWIATTERLKAERDKIIIIEVF